MRSCLYIMLFFVLLLQGCGHKGPLIAPAVPPTLQDKAP